MKLVRINDNFWLQIICFETDDSGKMGMESYLIPLHLSSRDCYKSLWYCFYKEVVEGSLKRSMYGSCERSILNMVEAYE